MFVYSHDRAWLHRAPKTACAMGSKTTDGRAQSQPYASRTFWSTQITSGPSWQRLLLQGRNVDTLPHLEQKQQSNQWRAPEQEPPKKAKVEHSARKVMATVFWDWTGPLLIRYMLMGTKINNDTYCAILKSWSARYWTEIVMSIFNRFFDNRLNRTSKNRFFLQFSKIRFWLIDHTKIIEKSILNSFIRGILKYPEVRPGGRRVLQCH